MSDPSFPSLLVLGTIGPSLLVLGPIGPKLLILGPIGSKLLVLGFSFLRYSLKNINKSSEKTSGCF